VKVELIEKDEESATFLVKGANTGLMNAFRRAIISEVPTLAIHEVYFFENSSPLWDEFIAHRLGLIPLKAEYGTYDENTEVSFTLDVSGPATVYSGQLVSSDSSVKPADDKIIIVKLMDGQKLRLEAKARMGNARMHAKWQAGLASYRYVYRAEVKDPEAVKKEGLDPKQVEKENKSSMGLSDATLNVLKDVEELNPDAVELKRNKDQFIFYVETYGNMTLPELIRAATDVLSRELEELAKVIG